MTRSPSDRRASFVVAGEPTAACLTRASSRSTTAFAVIFGVAGTVAETTANSEETRSRSAAFRPNIAE